MNEKPTPTVRHIKIHICQPCLDGIGDECHTPGCALFLHKVDLRIPHELYEDVTPASTPADAPKCDHSRMFDLPCGEHSCDKCGETVTVGCDNAEGKCKVCAPPAPTADATGEAGESEKRLDQLFLQAFGTNEPAMLDWVEIKFALKRQSSRIATLTAELESANDRLARIDDLTCDVKPDEDSEASGTIEQRVEALVGMATQLAEARKEKRVVGGEFYNGIEWFACWLLDNCEGEEVTEDQLRPWAVKAWQAALPEARSAGTEGK